FFEVANAYSETLIAQSLAVLAQEELEQYQKQLEVYQKKLQAGLARPLDISRGEYLFNKSKTNLILKKRDFERKRAQLGALISRKELFQVEDFLLESPYFDESLEILQSLAQNTAESNSLKLKYSAQNYSILSEGFNYFPILKTTIEGGLHTPPHDNSSPSHEAFSKIMFTIELPIFNQGLPHAELKKKIAQRDLIELSQRELQLTKHLGINGVLEQIQASQVALTSADLALKAAKKAKKSAERLYKAQEATALELVEANVNFSSAQSLFLNAQLHLKQSKLQLLYLIGKMSEIE
ncbi:MAG: TolC family protein, partial [Myxococcales bacterium]|nr:TolC family protein [Myxococcales bacterium]